MGEVDFTAIGQAVSTIVAICAALGWVARKASQKYEERHKETEAHLTKKMDANKAEIMDLVREVSARVDHTVTQLAAHEKAIVFLKERTAGLESKVFSRVPILEEDA